MRNDRLVDERGVLHVEVVRVRATECIAGLLHSGAAVDEVRRGDRRLPHDRGRRAGDAPLGIRADPPLRQTAVGAKLAQRMKVRIVLGPERGIGPRRGADVHLERNG